MQNKIKAKFTIKLILSLTALSVLGLLVVFVIVNTTVSDVMYDNKISIVYRDVHIISMQLDAQFGRDDDISLDSVIDTRAHYRILHGGYLILVGSDGEIIFHPNVEYIPTSERVVFLRDIPNGEFLLSNIASGDYFNLFDDYRFGTSYFLSFDVGATGWDLIAIIPEIAITEHISGYITNIMITFVIVLVALFVIVMFAMSTLTKHMEESRTTEERLRIIIDNMPLVSNFRDKKFNIIECNAEAVKLFELGSKEEYLDRFFELSPEFQPDGLTSKEKSETLIKEAFETGYIRFEWMHQKVTGEPIPTEVTLVCVEWQGDESLVAFVRDLREIYDAQKRERELAQRMQAMLDSSPVLCTIFDENSNVVEANREAERLFEIPDKQIYIDNYFAFSPEFQPDGKPSRQKALEMLDIVFEKGHNRFNWVYITSSGVPIPCEEIIMKVKLADGDLIIGYTRDLRDLQKLKETEDKVGQLQKVAYTDALTGIYNRRYFMEVAEKELQACINEDLPYSLIMIDVDHFKKINDTHGHDVGDEVLKILVARTWHTLKEDTFVARYGGEEFVVVLSRTDGISAVSIAERIRRHIESTAFVVQGQNLELDVTVSLGVSSKTESAATLSEIIKNADKALYEAKQTGRNKVVYN